MKAILYIIITIFIGSILINAIPVSLYSQNNTVKIQCVQKDADSILLNTSVGIISKRLNDFGIQQFKIKVNNIQKTATFKFDKSTDIAEILPLLVSKGEIQFSEMITREAFLQLPVHSDSLYNYLRKPAEMNNTVAIGTCKPELISGAEGYLFRLKTEPENSDVKLCWSRDKNENGEYILYAIKNNSLPFNQFISSVSVDKANKRNDLMINFDEEGSKLWQNLSKENIGKSLAISIDNRIYATPVVRTEIKEGKCMISGNYSLKEVSLLAAMLGNKALPLDFSIITR